VGTIERKGSENLAKSGATAGDQSNLGQAPNKNLDPPWGTTHRWVWGPFQIVHAVIREEEGRFPHAVCIM